MALAASWAGDKELISKDRHTVTGQSPSLTRGPTVTGRCGPASAGSLVVVPVTRKVNLDLNSDRDSRSGHHRDCDNSCYC